MKVPGPGAYDVPVKKDPSILKITVPTPRTKQYHDWVELAHVKVPIGPETYNPTGGELKKGVKMTQAGRSELKGSYMLSPAPNKYKLLGDFDFKNPNDPES